MKQADTARRGASAGYGSDTGVVLWKWRTSGRVPNVAIDRHGRIYLGSTFNEAQWSGEDYVTTLSWYGIALWRVKVPSYPWGFSQGANSSPSLDVYSNAVYNAPNANLLRFNTVGDMTLQIQGNSIAANNSAPAVLNDGTIFHHQFLALRKYNSAGNLQWTLDVSSLTDVAVHFTTGESAMGGIRSSEPHGSADITYINADGTLRWRRSSTRGSQANPTFSWDGSVVYCNLGSTTAITRDNVTLWAQPGGGYFNPLTLGRNGNVFRYSGTTIQCLAKDTGDILWSRQIVGTPVGSLAIDGRNFLYATTSNGYVVKLDTTTGEVLLSAQVCSVFTSGPAIANDYSIVAPGKEGFEHFVYKVK